MSGLKLSAAPATKHLDPIILLLKQYLQDTDRFKDLEKAVQTVLALKIPRVEKWGITSAEGFLDFANELLKWVPHENLEGKDILWHLMVFYFIIDQEPFRDLQTDISPKSIGKPMTWMSNWVVCYAQRLGTFMDSPASVTTESYKSFLASPLYKMSECIIPKGGFKTFNELFTRHLRPGMRPIASPDDPTKIVFPADSTFDGAWHVDKNSMISVKGLQWSIQALLGGAKYGQSFNSGIWAHSYLSPYNYHRLHAPVSGKVIEAKIIEGATFMKVILSKTHDGIPTLMPVRGYNPVGGVESGSNSEDSPSNPGYQFLQMRGLILIDNSDLGLVAVLPIGMAHVSSVKLSVTEGKVLNKGDEIAYFQFGGSDIVVVFQKKAGLTIECFPQTPQSVDDQSVMGEVMATANPIVS